MAHSPLSIGAVAAIFLHLVGGTAASGNSCSADGSCPSANGAAMVQLGGALDLRGEANEIDAAGGSGHSSASAKRSDSINGNRGRSSSAYTAYLRRKIAAVQASQEPAISELDDMIGQFIAHQSSSEDKCSSQLLEAKHQLNQLHVVINDLAAEINSTQVSIQVLEIQLTTKREEEEKVEVWKTEELHKCEVIREERRKMLYTLQQELIEMHHIARPDVTMDITGGTVSTGVALLEENAPGPISNAQGLVTETKSAAESLRQCVQAKSASLHPKVGLVEVQSTTAAPSSVTTECSDQKEVLEKTYVQTYVEITRLIAEYEDLIKSTSCEDTVEQEYNVKITPIRKEINELVMKIEALETKLEELRPRLVDAYNAEKSLRLQISTLTTQCSNLPETVTDLDKIRDSIQAMDKCPGLGAAEFNIPIWTKEWVSVRQNPGANDADLDAAMNAACISKFGESGAHPVRAAEVSEIMAVAVEGMPTTNTANNAIVGACPLCAGDEDAESGMTHVNGHARICWDPEVALSGATMRRDCSTGVRAVLCVYDRGNIRDQTREELESGSSGTISSTLPLADETNPPAETLSTAGPATANSNMVDNNNGNNNNHNNANNNNNHNNNNNNNDNNNNNNNNHQNDNNINHAERSPDNNDNDNDDDNTGNQAVSRKAISGAWRGHTSGAAGDGKQIEMCLDPSTKQVDTHLSANTMQVTCCDQNGVGSRPSCVQGVSWDTAATTCETNGLALCTADQLKSGSGEATGCKGDDRMTWSADSC